MRTFGCEQVTLTESLSGISREPDGIAWIGNGRLATANEGDLAGGSRGWSIFDARTGRALLDTGSSLERLAVSVGLYPESRSENKGTEPENITVATFGGQQYAFVGAERGNFVAVYTLSSGVPRFVQVLPVTNGPEGLLAIPSPLPESAGSTCGRAPGRGSDTHSRTSPASACPS
jgi:hypothetical protein